ncbi:MAG TPA: RluA family pseudouridine synthase [Pirellulaceae bacterium]|jgi:23S rRNA pseudouridine1911/1915/1917 synthase|nr:RluA family pseudouridine synthase [Pirellulaceae bacterium]
MRSPLHVLYEDNHLLAIDKPAGLASQGAAEDEESAVTLVRDYLKRKYDKPGNVYVGVVSRLDLPTTGVLLFARTSKAAARLSEAFKTRAVKKTYWALVEGKLDSREGELSHWLCEDPARRSSRICDEKSAGAKLARLTYRELAAGKGTAGSGWSAVEIGLLTGRKHQIRVQFADLGHPVLGDGKFGATVDFSPGIALHAHRIEFEHPVRKEPVAIEAPVGPAWRRFWPEAS